jgi:hypothetical protein
MVGAEHVKQALGIRRSALAECHRTKYADSCRMNPVRDAVSAFGLLQSHRDPSAGFTLNPTRKDGFRAADAGIAEAKVKSHDEADFRQSVESVLQTIDFIVQREDFSCPRSKITKSESRFSRRDRRGRRDSKPRAGVCFSMTFLLRLAQRSLRSLREVSHSDLVCGLPAA